MFSDVRANRASISAYVGGGGGVAAEARVPSAVRRRLGRGEGPGRGRVGVERVELRRRVEGHVRLVQPSRDEESLRRCSVGAAPVRRAEGSVRRAPNLADHRRDDRVVLARGVGQALAGGLPAGRKAAPAARACAKLPRPILRPGAVLVEVWRVCAQRQRLQKDATKMARYYLDNVAAHGRGGRPCRRRWCRSRAGGRTPAWRSKTRRRGCPS